MNYLIFHCLFEQGTCRERKGLLARAGFNRSPRALHFLQRGVLSRRPEAGPDPRMAGL